MRLYLYVLALALCGTVLLDGCRSIEPAAGSVTPAGNAAVATSPDLDRLSRAKGIGRACLIYAIDHGDTLPKQLADLLPDYAPSGGVFTGLSPEETIKGYDYFGGGVRASDIPGIITPATRGKISSWPVKTSDLPETIILRTSEPTSDGKRIVIFLMGQYEYQAAK